MGHVCGPVSVEHVCGPMVDMAGMDEKHQKARAGDTSSIPVAVVAELASTQHLLIRHCSKTQNCGNYQKSKD